MSSKVPITVATGFLGAGKTTLINHILKAQHGKKIAVIENEYGEISIDRSLVKQQLGTTEEIFELNNGCICCKVRGDLIRVLSKLLSRKQRMDAILVETTGLADPAPVIQTFFTDDSLKDQLNLDAILTVVDAKHCLQHINRECKNDSVPEAVQQVAFADRLLLNKVDLVSDREKAEVIRTLKGINSQAEIIECNLAQSPPDLDSILGLQSFDLSKILERDAHFLELDAEEDEHNHDDESQSHHHHHHDNEEDHHHHHEKDDGPTENGSQLKHHHHEHDSAVSSLAIVEKGVMNPAALNKWLGGLLQERGPDIFRSKGILYFHGDDTPTVFQGVHNMWQFVPAEVSDEMREGRTQRINKFVMIGRNLDKDEIRAAFKKCILQTALTEE